jgi:hypothetical protein
MQQTTLNMAPAQLKSYLVAVRSPTRFSLLELFFFMAMNQLLTLQLLLSTCNKLSSREKPVNAH